MRKNPVGLLNIYAVGFVALLYGPLVLLVLFSFNNSIYVAFPLKGATVRWYAALFDYPGLLSALWNSISVAVPVSITCTALGLLAAKALTGTSIPGRKPIIGLIMVPLVVPFIILGIALLTMVRKTLGLPLSLWTVGASHLLVCLPFSVLVLLSRFEGFDRSLEEASLDLGESAWMTFWRVTFPLVLPGVVSSLLLSFTASFDEFLLAFFLSGDKPTLPIYIWSQLRFPQKLPGVLALGSCIFTFSFSLVVLAERFRRKGTPGQHSTL